MKHCGKNSRENLAAQELQIESKKPGSINILEIGLEETWIA